MADNTNPQPEQPAFSANPPVITNTQPEQKKQEDYPNLNAGGPAPEQNQWNRWAEKFKTPEDRQAFLKAYINHVIEGYSDDSFSYTGSGIKVFKAYCEKYPMDFPSDQIEDAHAQRMKFWEGVGRRGTMGIPIKYKEIDANGNVVEKEAKGRFDSKAWVFNMTNRFKGWKMRTDVTSDDEKIEVPQIFIPEEKD